jgi:crotonobetainyl-CoA:carnitine CoA-transferase CaiB-like acyl-CoA transferase
LTWINAACLTRANTAPRSDLSTQLNEAKIAMGQVRTLKELGETEWAAWWGAVREVPDRRGGTYKLNGLPWHFSEDVPDPLTEPALRGEHNSQVFAELGYTDEEIREYTAQAESPER